MPLRVRLIALIGSVLLVSLACGSVLVAWRAAHSVRTELRAALDVGTKTIHNGLDELVASADRANELRRLVATFNGNRHVRVTLLDAQDQPVAVSRLLVPTDPAPGWFRSLIGGGLGAVRVPVLPAGGDGVVVLQTDPINEIGEVWAESRDAVLVLGGFALLSALLTCGVVGRALRPIEDLSTAFQQIGKGNYYGKVSENGPPELTRLASGFNLMTQQLAAAATQNRRLNERLLTLQAEERAELARDLHDEIGPLLFAVDMTAATIERLAGSDRIDAIPTQVGAIHDAVGRMQRHVRVILGRLRPIRAIGLAVAIERLAAFWRSRRPDISFIVAVTVEEDRTGDDLKETIYRIVQEAVSNAIRHGKPTRVEIAVALAGDDGVRVEVTDDGIGMVKNGMMADGVTGDGMAMDGIIDRDPAQLGLVGMRERVMAMAGSLSIRRGGNGRGLALVAWLPCADSVQSQTMAGTE
jgi:two-component system sensor histidine kinase UhpB